MAAKLLRYKRSEVDVADEDDDTVSPSSPLKGSKESVSVGEYIPLKNNYNSMSETIPLTPPPTADNEEEDPFMDDASQATDDKSGTGRSTISDDPSVDIPLHQAAREGNSAKLKRLIEDLKTNAAEDTGRFLSELGRLNVQGHNALHLAARYNRKSCVAYLLENGADINQPDGEDGNTPLLLSAKYNMTSTAKFLLENKADPLIQNIYGTSALHFAARRGNLNICRLLLAIPETDVNDKDNADQTPLHMAMLGGNKLVAKLLIEKGADLFVVDIEGEGPLHFAAAENNSELICTLTYGAIKDIPKDEREPHQRRFVNLASKEGDRALHVAAQAGYEQCVKTLVEIGGDVNVVTDTKDTPLHMAAISGQLEIVKYLIKNRAKVSARDEDQRTPLHRACQYGRLDVVQFLMTRKANLDARDVDGYTPLMSAVWKGQNDVVEYLIANKAKIYLEDNSGKTVLHIAAEEDRVSTIEILLQRKEAINLINNLDKENKSALHYTAIKGNQKALKLLLKNGADNDTVDREEMNPIHYAAKYGHLECVNSLMKKCAASIIHCTDKKGRQPLHLAAIAGHVDVCEALIDKGAECSGRDDISWTPLDYAAQHGFYKTMRVLLENDGLVDAVDKNNSTPLHHAARNGTVEAVQLLLEYHASLSLRNKDGKNCLDIAAENKNFDVCFAIVSHPKWMDALQYHEIDRKSRKAQLDTSTETNTQYPIQKLIGVAPEVTTAVLDRCIVKSNLPTTHQDYTITYKFELLDKLPPKAVGTKYFAPNTMVKYKRPELLSHPLVVKLVRHKWSKLGQGIYLANLAIYTIFMILLTTLILHEKRVRQDKLAASKSYDCHSSTLTNVIPWLTFVFACLQIVKEFIQIIYQRLRYLKEVSNWLEFILFVTTILFMLPFLLCQTGTEMTEYFDRLTWNSAAVAILLGWMNFLFYLKHIPFFGLHVTMLEEVFKSLLNVFVIFVILVFAFALSFFTLVNVQESFQDPGMSFIHSMVMMIGELDYDSMFTENYAPGNKQNLPYKGMTMFIFIAFVILMTIVLMNLLVGLAVGDIESVRKNAFLRILKEEVKILQIFERSCPMFILRRIHAKEFVEYPNRQGTFSRLLGILQNFDHSSVVKEQDEKGGVEANIQEEIANQRVEISKQKEKMKSVFSLIEEQLEKNRKLARKLGIIDS